MKRSKRKPLTVMLIPFYEDKISFEERFHEVQDIIAKMIINAYHQPDDKNNELWFDPHEVKAIDTTDEPILI